MAPNNYPQNDRDRGQARDPNPGSNRTPGDARDVNTPADAPLFPAGDFPVIPIAWKWGYAGTKNEQVGVRLRVLEGPKKNSTLLYYGSFHPNSEEFTLKALKALGILDLVWSKANGAIDAGDCQPAVAVVQHDEYQGKTTAKVAWINGADVQMKDEMNDGELAAFASRMRATVARMGGGQKRGSSTQSQQRDARGQDPRGAPPTQQTRDQQSSFGNPRGNDPPPDDEPWNNRGRG